MKTIIFIVILLLCSIFFYQLGYRDAVDRATVQHCIRATSYEEFEACALNFRDRMLTSYEPACDASSAVKI